MAARQAARGNDGKYENMNRCEICGKRLGDDYASDHRVDQFGGLGLVLCDRHMNMLADLPDDKALDLLRAASNVTAPEGVDGAPDPIQGETSRNRG